MSDTMLGFITVYFIIGLFVFISGNFSNKGLSESAAIALFWPLFMLVLIVKGFIQACKNI